MGKAYTRHTRKEYILRDLLYLSCSRKTKMIAYASMLILAFAEARPMSLTAVLLSVVLADNLHRRCDS